ncbi:family 10 glycosylhydrolase [Paenibacillus sp. MMS18-CY102]|nr:family 10 glycosylhydrolase [Paenibacillus sp. MMS18-CY102]
MALILVVVMIGTGIGGGSANAQAKQPPSISIYLDGQKLVTDSPPYIIPQANVTMVPIRVISEGLGASIEWVQQTKTATIRRDYTTIVMTANQSTAQVNGARVELGASVQVKQGRVMVPLRFVSEQLGLTVGYDQATRMITLVSPVDPVDPSDPSAGQQDGMLHGAWISTVFNLDWPSTGAYGNADKQKQEYVKLLDQLQGMGINTVFVQVRPAADALYSSQLVPWSKVLTGVQGKDPGYDPLAFLIDETHRRGMAFHAWFNPFRASTDASTASLAANHVTKQHPEWIVNAGGKPYINPGIPAARQHIIDTIMEVVAQYDVDGVHLDDYFYPSGGTFDDSATFQAYNDKRFTKLADWRRDNINEFVRLLGETVHAAKSGVAYGISPFGVWRNQSVDPTGSDTKASVTAYDSMYADVRTWIKQGWIDYVVPQIYWSLSFQTARYDKLVDWWSSEVSGTQVKLYIGHSPYKLGTAEAGWQSAQEIINQLHYNKQHPEVTGDIFFSAKDLLRNPLGLIPALQAYYGIEQGREPL